MRATLAATARNHNPQNRLLRAIACVAAAVLIAIGVVVMSAWHINSEWLWSSFPGLRMKYNSSLAFIVSGVGLFAAATDKKRLTMAAGSIGLIIGGIICVQYLVDGNFGVDQLLMKDYLSPNAEHPGRTSFRAGLAYSCFAMVLILSAGKGRQKLSHIIAQEILTFIVLAIAVKAIIGNPNFPGISDALRGLSTASPLGIPGLAVMGIGLAALIWPHRNSRIARVPLWLPMLLCFWVLVVDFSTPLGLAAGVAYIPIVFCSLWFAQPSMAFVFAAITTALTVFGYFTKPPSNIDLWIVIVNRALTTGALWLVAVLVFINRRSDGAFKQSRSRLQAVVDHALDGVIAINEQGIVEHFNPACERIFGYGAAEVVGRNIKMLMPEPYHGGHDGYLSRYLKTGEAHIIGTAGREVTARRKDGSEFPMDLSISVFQLEDGRHFSGIVRDISNRKHAEELRWQHAAVVESSVDAIITKNLGGGILTWNAAAERIFGYPAAEAIGQNIRVLIPPELQEDEARIIAEVTQGKRIEHYETVRLTKSGGRIPVSITVFPISDSSGRVIGVSKMARDISARRATEATLARYTTDLERSNQELDDFAYIASHDLKEPLRGLFNHASFLLEDYKSKLDAEGVRRLERLGQLCQRMEQLINDLMYFSRLGRAELAVRETDIDTVIVDIQKTMDVFIDERRAQIVRPRSLPKTLCDPVRTAEVFRNLITNAIKYCDKPKPLVEIGFLGAADAGEAVDLNVFYVKDNGIGIDPAFHQEIFRIFKRLQPSNGKEAGSGVGLTFVKKIVERQGGRIWLDSEVGTGTTFYFTLNNQKGGAGAVDPVKEPHERQAIPAHSVG